MRLASLSLRSAAFFLSAFVLEANCSQIQAAMQYYFVKCLYFFSQRKKICISLYSFPVLNLFSKTLQLSRLIVRALCNRIHIYILFDIIFAHRRRNCV